jgi:hypothetical protein
VREDFHVCKDYELSFVSVEFSIACLRSITANSTIAKGRPHPKK